MSLDIWLTATRETQVFDANYTHNVTPMWRKAGIYDALYNSEGKAASEVLPILRAGLRKMKRSPETYRKLDADNGWGTYDTALPWLERLVEAFAANPDGVIGIWK